MYFVGIDIAKRFHEAAVINEQGKIIIKQIKISKFALRLPPLDTSAIN